MISVHPEDRAWLEAFFGPGNGVQWDAIASEVLSPHIAQHIAPWLTFLEHRELQRPVVLPVFGPEGPIRWYGVANSSPEMAQLGEELLSYLGSGITDFDGTAVQLHETDPIEAALRARFGPVAFKFQTGSSGSPGEVLRRLRLYASVLSRRPPMTNRGRQPFGRIRADFDAALLAGNEDGARGCIEELALTGRLSADQRKCLEIRLYAGLGRYEDLALNRSLLDAVVEIHLPAQTLADLVSALYKTHVEPFIVAEASYSEVVAAFKARVAKHYGPLFRERKGLVDPDVLCSFALFAAGCSPADVERCEAIQAACPEGLGAKKWLSGLVDWLRANERTVEQKGEESQDSWETQIRLAIGDEDFERALGLCLGLPPSAWTHRAMVRCALELGTATAAKEVLGRIDQAGPSSASSFRHKDLQRVASLRLLLEGEAGPTRLAGWLPFADWLQRETPSPGIVQERLKEAIPKWSPSSYETDLSACAELARIIGNSSGATEDLFRFVLPDLVEFFVERPKAPSRAFAPLYAVLINVLARSESVTTDEIELVLDFLCALLESAPSTQLYEDALEDLIELVKAHISPNRVDWALAVCELLVFYPSPSLEVRLRLFAGVAARLSSWSHRLSSAQRYVFRALANDFQCPDLANSVDRPAADSVADSEVPNDYDGEIAIYTLAERAGQYARSALLALFPRAQVAVNSDLVATDALKSLARTAKVFVFTWKRATHPAFYCVKDIRGLDGIVQPEGGGAASIVRAAIKEISRQTALA